MFIQLQAIYGPVHMFKIYHLVEELLWPVPSAVPSHIMNYYGQFKCPTISHRTVLVSSYTIPSTSLTEPKLRKKICLDQGSNTQTLG